VDRLEATAASLRGGEGASLRVAASLTVAEYLLPRWLIKIRTLSPGFPPDIAVTAANSAGVFDLVRAGSHTLGFVETPDIPGDLRYRAVAQDELVVVVPAGHEWLSRPEASVSLEELAATPLVCREAGSGTRLSYERLLRVKGGGAAIAAPALKLPTTAAVKTAVLAGTAPAALSVLSVRDDVETGRLRVVRIKDQRLVRRIAAVWDASTRSLPTLARQLIATADPHH
jgi:DNA-binding transcriptional LysR family regulator